MHLHTSHKHILRSESTLNLVAPEIRISVQQTLPGRELLAKRQGMLAQFQIIKGLRRRLKNTGNQYGKGSNPNRKMGKSSELEF